MRRIIKKDKKISLSRRLEQFWFVKACGRLSTILNNTLDNQVQSSYL